MDLLLSGIVQGVLTGLVLAFITSGMTVIYRISRVTNFAHGSLLALAMYLTFDLGRRVSIDPLWLSLIVAPVMGALGALLYWAFIRPLRRRHHLLAVQLLLGLSFVIDAFLLMRYGADLQSVKNGLSARYIRIFGTGFAMDAILASILAALGLAALTLAFQYSAWGRKTRAAASDELATKLAGVSVTWLEGTCWGLGMALLGLIAPALSSNTALTPDMGLHYTVLALVVLIVGGAGSIAGTIVAGMLIGIAQSLGLLYLPGSYGALLPYALLVAVLVLRPGGIAMMIGRA